MLLTKCLKLKKILRIEPNIIVSESFLSQAEKTLSKVQDAINEEDCLWASVKIYYAAYYALTAFLWRLGIRSENHDCAIKITTFIVEDAEIEHILEKLKAARIDNQYYLKISDKDALEMNHNPAKLIYAKFYNLISNFDNKIYEKRINKLLA